MQVFATIWKKEHSCETFPKMKWGKVKSISHEASESGGYL